MKRISLIILFATVFGVFASCDKINEGEYTVYAGAAGTWYETDVEIPHVQRAFIEKYTGVRCINCPTADEVIHAASNKYGDSVVVVAVHARSTGFGRPLGNDPNLCTESGDEWYDFFGIASQPAAIINRSLNNNSWDIFTPTTNFDNRINAIVAKTPQVAIAVESGNEDNDAYYSDIFIEILNKELDDLTLTLLLTEDKIYTRQSQQGVGEIEHYEQNHVLRTVVTNLWGTNIPSNILQSGKAMIRFYYDLPDNFNADNCHAVAFVSHQDSRQIINSAQSNLR